MSSISASDAAPLPRLGDVFFDARGSSRSMRLSWYSDTGIAVFSMWQGGTCTGTFRLPVDDLSRIIDSLRRGLPGDPAEQQAAGVTGQAAPDGQRQRPDGQRQRPALGTAGVEPFTGAMSVLTDEQAAAYGLPVTGGHSVLSTGLNTRAAGPRAGGRAAGNSGGYGNTGGNSTGGYGTGGYGNTGDYAPASAPGGTEFTQVPGEAQYGQYSTSAYGAAQYDGSGSNASGADGHQGPAGYADQGYARDEAYPRDQAYAWDQGHGQGPPEAQAGQAYGAQAYEQPGAARAYDAPAYDAPAYGGQAYDAQAYDAQAAYTTIDAPASVPAAAAQAPSAGYGIPLFSATVPDAAAADGQRLQGIMAARLAGQAQQRANGYPQDHARQQQDQSRQQQPSFQPAAGQPGTAGYPNTTREPAAPAYQAAAAYPETARSGTSAYGGYPPAAYGGPGGTGSFAAQGYPAQGYTEYPGDGDAPAAVGAGYADVGHSPDGYSTGGYGAGGYGNTGYGATGNGAGPLNGSAYPGTPSTATPTFTPSFTPSPAYPATNGSAQYAPGGADWTGGQAPSGPQSPPAMGGSDMGGYGTAAYQDYPQEPARQGFWDGDHQRSGGNWP